MVGAVQSSSGGARVPRVGGARPATSRWCVDAKRLFAYDPRPLDPTAASPSGRSSGRGAVLRPGCGRRGAARAVAADAVRGRHHAASTRCCAAAPPPTARCSPPAGRRGTSSRSAAARCCSSRAAALVLAVRLADRDARLRRAAAPDGLTAARPGRGPDLGGGRRGRARRWSPPWWRSRRWPWRRRWSSRTCAVRAADPAAARRRRPRLLVLVAAVRWSLAPAPSPGAGPAPGRRRRCSVATAEAPGATAAAGAAVTCHGLVKVYRSATGETHALRGHRPAAAARASSPWWPARRAAGRAACCTCSPPATGPAPATSTCSAPTWPTRRPGELRELRRRRIGFVAQRSSGCAVPAPHRRRAAAPGRRAARRRRRADVEPGAGRGRPRAPRPTTVPSASSGGEQQRLAVALALVGAARAGRRRRADRRARPRQRRPGDGRAGRWPRTPAAPSWSPATTNGSVDRADRVLRLRHGVLSSEQHGPAGDTVARHRLDRPAAAAARGARPVPRRPGRGAARRRRGHPAAAGRGRRDGPGRSAGSATGTATAPTASQVLDDVSLTSTPGEVRLRGRAVRLGQDRAVPPGRRLRGARRAAP